jgi:hypothetical protein
VAEGDAQTRRRKSAAGACPQRQSRNHESNDCAS